jgi:hypothetical protein
LTTVAERTFDVYPPHPNHSPHPALSLENREPSRALQMIAVTSSRIIESHHSHEICSPGLWTEARFYQMASMRIRRSFDGIVTRTKPLPPHAALIAVV